MYNLRSCIRTGLLIGAGLGILTETLVVAASGRGSAVHMFLRGAADLVRIVPLG